MSSKGLYKEVEEYLLYETHTKFKKNIFKFLVLLLPFIFIYILLYFFEKSYYTIITNYSISETDFCIFLLIIKFLSIIIFIFLMIKIFPKQIEYTFIDYKKFILHNLLKFKKIHFFKLVQHNDFLFNGIDPRKIIFYTKETKKPLTGNNNFIFLNSHKFTDSNFLRPYCNIILCSQYTDILDQKNLWYYFLSLYFAINIIYSSIIFIALYGIHFFINDSTKIWLLGLFIILLTYFFGRTLWIFIKNIHIQACNKEEIIQEINNFTPNKTQILLSDGNYKNKLNEYFLILHGKQHILATLLFDEIDKRNKDITSKISAIIQIAAPLFYLAYITVTVSIFIKFTP